MDNPTSTFALLEKARADDRESLSALFEKHQRRLAVLVYFKLSPHARRDSEVEDIVQETYLRALKDLSGFDYRSPGCFTRWLSSIADHVIIDRRRYLGREKRDGIEVRFRSESNPAGADPADTCTPSRLFARREQLDRLIGLLDKLPEDYRQVLLMAKFEELTTQQIAERLGKSRENVALLVYRAVKRLRTLAEGAS